MTKIKVRFSVLGHLCLLAALGGCIVVADDGSSASEEDEIFADEQRRPRRHRRCASASPRSGARPGRRPGPDPPTSMWSPSGTGCILAASPAHTRPSFSRSSTREDPLLLRLHRHGHDEEGARVRERLRRQSGAPLCQKGAAYVRANIAPMASAYQKGGGRDRRGPRRARGADPHRAGLVPVLADGAAERAHGDGVRQLHQPDPRRHQVGLPLVQGGHRLQPVVQPVGHQVGAVGRRLLRRLGSQHGQVRRPHGQAIPFTTGKIDNFTYKEITTAVSLPLVIVDAYTFGGGPINVDSTWLNESNVAKAVDMGVADVMLSQTGDVAGYDSFIARVKGSSSSSSSRPPPPAPAPAAPAPAPPAAVVARRHHHVLVEQQQQQQQHWRRQRRGQPRDRRARRGRQHHRQHHPQLDVDRWLIADNVKLTKADSGETTWKLYVPSNGATLRDFGTPTPSSKAPTSCSPA